MTTRPSPGEHPGKRAPLPHLPPRPQRRPTGVQVLVRRRGPLTHSDPFIGNYYTMSPWRTTTRFPHVRPHAP